MNISYAKAVLECFVEGERLSVERVWERAGDLPRPAVVQALQDLTGAGALVEEKDFIVGRIHWRRSGVVSKPPEASEEERWLYYNGVSNISVGDRPSGRLDLSNKLGLSLTIYGDALEKIADIQYEYPLIKLKPDARRRVEKWVKWREHREILEKLNE